MSSVFQSVRGRAVLELRFVLCALLVFGLCGRAVSARAGAPQLRDAIAHLEGADVSIDGQMLERTSTLASVVDGNVVTVHSGQARLRLVDGGQILICGPAKITVLQSNGQITLALEFGSLHADLPKSASVRVLTPSIVATPIDINGAMRSVTVGLDQSASLCVVAGTGAVQLEQQFSGERLIVPENGDFALHGGQLIASADDGRSCQCAAETLPEPSGKYPAPESADRIPAPDPVAAVPGGQTADRPDPQQQSGSDRPPVQLALLSRSNQDRPVVPPAAMPPVEQPAIAPADPPVSKIILPPLVFSATSAPDLPTEQTALLIRQVRAQTEWEYDGRVESPELAKDVSRALGMGASKKPHSQAPGFWASLKRLLIG